MSHNVLITGASGYLGGDLLAGLSDAKLPTFGKLYALVRTQEQAKAVQQHGAEPLTLDVTNEDAIRDALLSKEITIVFFLIDSFKSVSQELFIKALGEVRKKTGSEVHFLHTSGAKMFSSHAGAPTDRQLYDDDPDLYTIHKAQRPRLEPFKIALNTNNTIVELAEANQVRSYVFVPCIVYGKGRGFGNPISIQTVAIVKAAKAVRRVYRTDAGRPDWPVCHVIDNTGLYIQILCSILENQNPGYGKQGYYLASPGSVAWDDIYSGFAKALATRGVVDDETVRDADDAALDGMAAALDCSRDFVNVQLGGKCTFTPSHGNKIGWRAQYKPEHIFEAADDETGWILQNLKD
ncbi:hypothetical protein NM208_g5251 [Fusarium decemcellulare]|uniref:Uncharacterized protein n=2 Tax=Fusarium decemcellulare TaxID=57161 RepID=A0ACC1RTT9_9HYPO|nr:hypothetical protein NM208_g11579 [Fusarium decemcellulare]KAJ3539991.1 hypothetical protein NM208_g5251 [Fusarium decemcellulare]